ncbi:MAG TPA: hypothetical protein VKU00_12695 [Chthonomonadaceae bacterium]|nr:hypothetical protein [Chthonomonadaceae bacterium]
MRLTRQQRLQREQAAREVRDVAEQQGMEAMTSLQLVELLAAPHRRTAEAAFDTLNRRGSQALAALVVGLAHANGKIRAISALLLDHHGDDRCAEPLRHALRHDPLEAVRRCAMHALACQNCKVCPLQADIVGALLEAALHDRSLHVRRCAVQYLVGQRPDPRAVTAAQTLLATESDPALLLRTHRMLAWHTHHSAVQ